MIIIIVKNSKEIIRKNSNSFSSIYFIDNLSSFPITLFLYLRTVCSEHEPQVKNNCKSRAEAKAMSSNIPSDNDA